MESFLRRSGIDFLCTVIIIIIASATIPSSAQTSSGQDLLLLSIEDLGQVKVYSASRHPEEVRQSPSSVSIVTADEIRRYGWRTLADALRSLRGFYTAYDRNYTYLGVRGFLRPGDYNSRILLLLNGHRLNDNVYGGASIATEFPLDLDLIDHIEIVRGPGASLFGNNAIFGVINIITHPPASPYSIELSGDTSSFFGRSGRLTGSMTRGRLSGLISGGLYQSAGPSRLFFPEFALPETNSGYADNVDGDRYGHFFSDIRYGSFIVQGLFSGRKKIIPTASYDTVFNDPGSRTTDRNAYLDVQYRHSFGRQAELELRAFYDHYDYFGTYAYTDNSSQRVLNLDRSAADWSGIEATFNRTIAAHHHLTLGASYEYSFRVDQKTWYQGMPPLLDDHRTPWLAGAFAEAEIQLRPSLVLHAGLRLDYFDAYGTAASPRAALVYSPTSRTTLKYIFGRAFRAPNSYESYYADGVSQELPSSPLKKENIQSHEAVFDQGLTSWLGITADAYYNNLDHLIDFESGSSTGLVRAANVGKVRGKGIEFELYAKHPWGWEGRASYAFAHVHDQVALQPLDNSPGHQAKLNTILPVTRHGFAGLELQYISAQTSYRATRVSPAFLTNLTVSTRPFRGGWELSASCYNLLDRRWFTPAGFSNTQPSIEQDGRTLRFKVSYRISKGEKRDTR